LLFASAFIAAAASRPLSAAAVEIALETRPVARRVLALYDGKAEGQPSATRIHQLVEMPLNHLGYEVVYHDVAAGPPGPDDLVGVRAVLTWFLEPLKEPRTVGEWLWHTIEPTAMRYVVFGEVLPGLPSDAHQVSDRLFAKLGIIDSHDYVDLGFASRVTLADKAMIGFERPIDKVLPGFPVLGVASGRIKVHLSVSVPYAVPEQTSALVATGSGGGYAAEGFAIYYEPQADRMAWTLNPFRFLREALGEERFPIPDVTTLDGRRIYFSHIDGDGWNNVTEIEAYKAGDVSSSEVVLKEAIAPFPDLPVSVALIGCDVDPAVGGRASAGDIARRIFALPQVEVASHTHSHPYDWKFFERYNRQAEIEKIEALQQPQPSLRESLNQQIFQIAGKPLPVTAANKYVAGTDDLPRTFLKNPFDLGTEVAGALRVSESFAPPGKKAGLYQWSGDTMPFEAAIKATRLAGVPNINGGDSRLDREFPSVAYIPPISRKVGRERQIYAANSNENTYTNDWTGPYYGFFMLEETLRNTDLPRRLKPFNLYYHMYSGEKPAALAAVRHFLQEARAGDVIPIAASQYSKIADSFFGVAIAQVGATSWTVSNRGALQTVRFDHAEDVTLDFAGSRGVIGARRHGDALYVSLDPVVERAIVTIADRRAAETDAKAPPVRPLLLDSRWQLSGVAGEGCGFTAHAEGYGRGEMRFETQPGRRLTVTARRQGGVVTTAASVAASDGVAALTLDADALDGLELEVTCGG